MADKKVVLDFNSKDLKFSLNDLSKYDVDAIYKNIDAFNKFAYGSVTYDCFDKVYNTSMFQMAILDESTNYIENLVAVYNAVAEGDLLEDEKLPRINNKEMMKQLRIRGYKIIHSNIKIIQGEYKHVRKAVRTDRLSFF